MIRECGIGSMLFRIALTKEGLPKEFHTEFNELRVHVTQISGRKTF